MTIKTMSEIFYHPSIAMKHIRDEKLKDSNEALITLALLALIPPVSLLIGTTQIGWSLSLSGDAVRLSFASALLSATAFYIALCISLLVVGVAIHWMEHTYGGEASLERCMNLTLYTATPLLVAGLAGLYPTLWFCVVAGMVGLIYSTYLLFTGVPVIMRIPEERGFLFCMSILTVGLVTLVTLRALTVFLWNSLIPLIYLG
ncbi:Yip1 family protein [Pontibacterium granulatum]|uniref:Yip1 family protein n=1 Tax=Pontibacterium granulatum TaxID=2036029 RepID=UPI00249CB18A|nr:Yip1 family protein [Pontibacterium granulatum]MDI3323965.1 Yip1 family protein [Pontibacterium granulatum]